MAKKMISISDNTATDHLIHLVGREKIEAFLSRENMNDFPRWNRPFISTREMFITRAYFTPKDVKRFVGASRAKRMEMISRYSGTGLKELGEKLSNWHGPLYHQEIEWFSTPENICHLFAWFFKNPSKESLEILGTNIPYIEKKSSRWNVMGYKGGSEPGVLEMAYYLEDKKGQGHCLYMGQNDTEKTISTERFDAIIKGVLGLLEKN
jgi:hypothetical protein